MISDHEKKSWFPGAKKFYHYKIASFQKFNSPQIVQLKPGTQSIQNMYSDELKNYETTNMSKQALADDWKIVTSWFSLDKQGKPAGHEKNMILNTATKILNEFARRGVCLATSKLSNELIHEAKNFSKEIPEIKTAPANVEIINNGSFKITRTESSELIDFTGLHFRITNKFPKLKQTKAVSFKIADFGKSTKTIQMKDIKFPYRFPVVAFSEGRHNDRFYPWDVIKKAAPGIMNIEVVTYHVKRLGNDSILTSAGKVTDFKLNEGNKKLIAEIELFETAAGKDLALLHANKRLRDVSMQIDEDEFPGDCQEIKELIHIAFVREGGVADAKVCYDGICQ